MYYYDHVQVEKSHWTPFLTIFYLQKTKKKKKKKGQPHLHTTQGKVAKVNLINILSNPTTESSSLVEETMPPKAWSSQKEPSIPTCSP